jgi:hypothetical protein
MLLPAILDIGANDLMAFDLDRPIVLPLFWRLELWR